MTRTSVEDLVLGHVLDGKRRGRSDGGGAEGRLGSPKERRSRALLRNAAAPRMTVSAFRPELARR